MCLANELTAKQWRITALVANGLKNKEIAPHLRTTEYVIKNHIKDILERTGCFNRVELALRFVHHQHECRCNSAFPQLP
jgi:DNA-binding NarL/FixJ family response regulator